MRKSRFSDGQIAQALRQAELGTPIAELTRKLRISEATFYVWKKRFGKLGTPEIRELRQLREENTKLKHVVADLTLDRAVLQDVLKKSGEARSAADGEAAGAQDLAAQRTPRMRHPGLQPQDAALPVGQDGRSGSASTYQRDRGESHSVRLQPDHRIASP